MTKYCKGDDEASELTFIMGEAVDGPNSGKAGGVGFLLHTHLTKQGVFNIDGNK